MFNKLLKQYQFYIKITKYAFELQELEYLEHVIISEGVKVYRKKIKITLKWSRPTNVTNLRGFLKLTCYYRKFVHIYGIIARISLTCQKRGI